MIRSYSIDVISIFYGQWFDFFQLFFQRQFLCLLFSSATFSFRELVSLRLEDRYIDSQFSFRIVRNRLFSQDQIFHYGYFTLERYYLMLTF